jgi:PAS domain S-box-containing protein
LAAQDRPQQDTHILPTDELWGDTAQSLSHHAWANPIHMMPRVPRGARSGEVHLLNPSLKEEQGGMEMQQAAPQDHNGPSLRRVAVAVGFGLLGFFLNFVDLQLLDSPYFKISILLGFLFPLTITLAWGWRWGLISALAGGCQTMWWLWRTDGWGLLYAVPIFILWIVWHGWWADHRHRQAAPAWYTSVFAVEIPFRIISELGFYVVFRWLVSLNPPPWDPSLAQDFVPLSWVNTIAVSHVIQGYLLLVMAYVAISVTPGRRFFRLAPLPAQSDTDVIYGTAILLGILFWIADAVIEFAVFNPVGTTLWGMVFLDVPADTMLTRLLFLATILAGAIMLAQAARKKALLQERVEHLNRVLNAIRQVNHLVTNEKDTGRLLQGACNKLVETRGYYNAWIALFDHEGQFVSAAQAGLDETFALMAANLKHGKFTARCRTALQQPDVTVTLHPAVDCEDCPLRSAYPNRASLAVRLEHDSHVYGLLSATTDREFAGSDEEQRLFQEIAQDLALGFHGLEQVRERESAELQREEMRDALAVSEHRFRSIYENLSVGVSQVSLDFRIMRANDAYCQFLGYSEEELIGRRLRELVRPAMLERDQKLQSQMASGEIDHFRTEEQYIHKDGHTVYGILSGSLVRDAHGTPLYYLGSVQDITHHKQAEEHTAQQERLAAVGQLAAGIAHDFNNMLTGIIGYAELLQTQPKMPKEPALSRIIEQGQRAANLTRQILDFGRQSMRQPRPMELRSALEEAIGFIRRTVPENIKIRIDAKPKTYIVEADPTQFQQIVTNLALNARDAMPMGGELIFTLDRQQTQPGDAAPVPEMAQGEWIVVSVSDTGSGIPSDMLRHIFEPFYTTKETGKGTGLGLAQVYGIVKQHQGEITVESQLGMGTTFSIYLPASDSKLGVQPKTKLGSLPRGSRETLLLVEDNQNVRDLVRTSLENLGYQVLTAANGEEAVETFGAHRDSVSLVLTDMVMPQMDGLALLRALHALQPDIKVVILSGYPENAEMTAADKRNLVAWLNKPPKLKELAETVHAALADDAPQQPT